ncbi:MAG: DUF6879 family protein [Pseudonocardiaceae bacterium]
MMGPAELRAYLDTNFTRTLFRLETLSAYEVPSEGSDFARYLAGEPAPSPERHQRWLDRLADEVFRGLRRRRVHVVHLPLSNYLRFECEWSYALNPYEDIRILVLATERTDLQRLVDDAGGDFYLVDDEHLIRMRYTTENQPLGAEVDSSPAVVAVCRRIADVLWSGAEPFGRWWAAHPQFHRDHRAA